MPLCRDCLSWDITKEKKTCGFCGSPKLINHDEINHLNIAHIDCDAFYASIEKRDNKNSVLLKISNNKNKDSKINSKDFTYNFMN